MRAQRAGGRVRPDQRMAKESLDSQDSCRIDQAPGRYLTAIHTSDRICLPHRHYSEQGDNSRLDPISHSGCVRSLCMGGWTHDRWKEATLDPRWVKEFSVHLLLRRAERVLDP
ncbi:hypothetical protein CRG98_001227 [Punica granatum]|uniref:Uncharacterized protein n=1 Tax=Punica granatum TaxID=22663 RepID=A0A2I0LDV7_PUNGR|nr:hypothetical protein CRG98_001227 [Punica granatum]